MIKIEKKAPLNYNYSEYVLDISKQGLYVDIETTGLSHNSNIVSISALTVEDNNFVITQLFSECEEDQECLLNEFIKIMSVKKYILSYNGTTFDIPFLKAKFMSYNLDFDFNGCINVDLYKYVQNQKYKLNLDSLQLSSIEKYFGIDRIDTLSGYDVTRLYKLYLYNHKKAVMDLILRHNLEDISYLPIIFDKLINTYELVIKSDLLGLLLIDRGNIAVKGKYITIKVRCIGQYKLNYIVNGKSTYTLDYTCETNMLSLKLNLNFAENEENTITYFYNDEILLKSFKSLEVLKDNIIPIEINKIILYDNIYKITEKIILSL